MVKERRTVMDRSMPDLVDEIERLIGDNPHLDVERERLQGLLEELKEGALRQERDLEALRKKVSEHEWNPFA